MKNSLHFKTCCPKTFPRAYFIKSIFLIEVYLVVCTGYPAIFGIHPDIWLVRYRLLLKKFKKKITLWRNKGTFCVSNLNTFQRIFQTAVISWSYYIFASYHWEGSFLVIGWMVKVRSVCTLDKFLHRLSQRLHKNDDCVCMAYNCTYVIYLGSYHT